MSMLLLEFDGAEIAEGGMQALAIVPNLNVFKERGACRCKRYKLTGHTFCFQCSKETFSHCIVITIANPAHTELDVPVCQGALVVSTGVLAALVRMVKQRSLRMAGLQGHLCQRQLEMDMATIRNAHKDG
jgi:hypothetical protein